MNRYIRVMELGAKRALEFRARMFFWLLVHLSPFIVVPFFWTYILFSNTSEIYTPERIITYYVLIVFVTSLAAAATGNKIEDDIVEGGVVSFLVKPISYVGHMFASMLGGKLISGGTIILLFLGANILFSETILRPASWVHVLFFIVSVFIAIGITFLLNTLVSLGSFWWGRSGSLSSGLHWVQGLFGGQFAPLIFYPAFIVSVAHVLPFQFLFAVPVGMYLGDYSRIQMIRLFLTGLFWVIVLVGVVSLVWKKGIRQYDSPN